MCFEMEGGGLKTEHRFYFDKELYIRKYVEDTGRTFTKKRFSE